MNSTDLCFQLRSWTDPGPNSSIQMRFGEIKELKALNMWKKNLTWYKWSLPGDIQNVTTVYI